MKRFVIGTFSISAFAVALLSAQAPASHPSPAQPAQPARIALVPPASAGVSSERLERLHKGVQGFVDRHEVGGIVTLVAREGKIVDLHASGFQDVEKQTPMKTDSIFRIASMSKPITSVAIMMLYEENKLFLTDPVSKYIPAFKSSMVSKTASPWRRAGRSRFAICCRIAPASPTDSSTAVSSATAIARTASPMA